MSNYNVYHEFLPILIFFVVTILIALALSLGGSILSKLFGSHDPSSSKRDTFECGFPETGDARNKFDVRFYLVAILFIVFDLEIAFMVPWAILVRKGEAVGHSISNTAFMAMFIFLFILLIGFLYEWRKGALEWE